ncbi:hypothetical protein HHL24_40215 [Paraburkholderia sp. RP-4-7]|uniref:Uncharacterized protein n=1 Tax=Paraburkholderia polaris TaxID=2728848 RepID=A0A848ISJ7_9BURK|nr:hypothetical protein [Paraburkholderia polaris]NMM04073.1 hypothetical protein [Paraburkholderia polaris]
MPNPPWIENLPETPPDKAVRLGVAQSAISPTLTHILAHIDRNILLGFSSSLIADLGLSNVQYGLLVGPSGPSAMRGWPLSPYWVARWPDCFAIDFLIYGRIERTGTTLLDFHVFPRGSLKPGAYTVINRIGGSHFEAFRRDDLRAFCRHSSIGSDLTAANVTKIRLSILKFENCPTLRPAIPYP